MASLSGQPRSSLMISLTKRRACAVVRAGAFFKLQAYARANSSGTYAHQEEMRDKGVCHMMMPTAPRTRLIMIHADFTFAFFKSGLHGPAHAAKIGEVPRRIHRGRVAQVILDLARRTQAATANRPHARSGQPIAHRGHAHESKFCAERTFASLLDEKRAPRRPGQSRSKGLHCLCVRRISLDRDLRQFHAGLATRSSQRAATRPFDGRRAQPHARITGHFGEIPFAQSRNCI